MCQLHHWSCKAAHFCSRIPPLLSSLPGILHQPSSPEKRFRTIPLHLTLPPSLFMGIRIPLGTLWFCSFLTISICGCQHEESPPEVTSTTPSGFTEPPSPHSLPALSLCGHGEPRCPSSAYPATRARVQGSSGPPQRLEPGTAGDGKAQHRSPTPFPPLRRS